jgi:casein kinase II subunit beta
MTRRPRDLRSRFVDFSARSWFVEIDDYFLQSSVSYYNLHQWVSHFNRAATVVKGESIDLSSLNRGQVERIGESTHRLYGLLHQRFVITDDGARKLQRKVSAGIYGICPRLVCGGAKLLPYGSTVEPDEDRVKCWCPRCHDLYESTSDLDAAYFGPDLPGMYCKVIGVSLKFNVASTYLRGYVDENGERVKEIEQRLVRWGEFKRS